MGIRGATQTTLKCKERLKNGHVYFGAGGEEYYDLYPYIVSSFCENCRSNRLFVAEKREGRRLCYLGSCEHTWENDVYK